MDTVFTAEPILNVEEFRELFNTSTSGLIPLELNETDSILAMLRTNVNPELVSFVKEQIRKKRGNNYDIPAEEFEAQVDRFTQILTDLKKSKIESVKYSDGRQVPDDSWTTDYSEDVFHELSRLSQEDYSRAVRAYNALKTLPLLDYSTFGKTDLKIARLMRRGSVPGYYDEITRIGDEVNDYKKELNRIGTQFLRMRVQAEQFLRRTYVLLYYFDTAGEDLKIHLPDFRDDETSESGTMFKEQVRRMPDELAVRAKLFVRCRSLFANPIFLEGYTDEALFKLICLGYSKERCLELLPAMIDLLPCMEFKRKSECSESEWIEFKEKIDGELGRLERGSVKKRRI